MPPKQTVGIGGGAIFSGPSPEYADRRNARLQQSMQFTANLMQQKRESERRTAETQAKLIMGDPYSAATGAGEAWINKWGTKYPVLSAQVHSAMRRGEPVVKGYEMARDWMDRRSQDEEFFSGARAQLDALPQTITETVAAPMDPAMSMGGAFPMGPGGFPGMPGGGMSPSTFGLTDPSQPTFTTEQEVPNPVYQGLAERLDAIEQTDNGWLDMLSMNPIDQEYLALGLKAMGMEAPATFNNLTTRFTQQTIDALMCERLGPKVCESIRIRQKMQPGMGYVEEQSLIQADKSLQENARAQLKSDLMMGQIDARNAGTIAAEEERQVTEGMRQQTATARNKGKVSTTLDGIYDEFVPAYEDWEERRDKEIGAANVLLRDAKKVYRAELEDAKAFTDPELKKAAKARAKSKFDAALSAKFNEEDFQLGDPAPAMPSHGEFAKLKKRALAIVPDLAGQQAFLRQMMTWVLSGEHTVEQILAGDV